MRGLMSPTPLCTHGVRHESILTPVSYRGAMESRRIMNTYIPTGLTVWQSVILWPLQVPHHPFVELSLPP